jgi:PKD repeat protein
VATWSWSSPGRPNRTGVTAVWGFGFAGTYSVSLTVTDNNGAPNTKTVNVIVQ